MSARVMGVTGVVMASGNMGVVRVSHRVFQFCDQRDSHTRTVPEGLSPVPPPARTHLREEGSSSPVDPTTALLDHGARSQRTGSPTPLFTPMGYDRVNPAWERPLLAADP
jgi:hypothetical protein